MYFYLMLFTLYSLKRLPGGNETVGNTIFCLKCGFLYKYLKDQLYDNEIENFHTFLYIYRDVRLTAKANELSYFFIVFYTK